jgi:hypothetical protein
MPFCGGHERRKVACRSVLLVHRARMASSAICNPNALLRLENACLYDSIAAALAARGYVNRDGKPFASEQVTASHGRPDSLIIVNHGHDSCERAYLPSDPTAPVNRLRVQPQHRHNTSLVRSQLRHIS